MKKTAVSRHLVVDASVMRAAGGTDHPTSSSCRNTLKAIIEICHHVLISKPIEAEWDKHASRFSRKWKITMMNKRKVDKVSSSLAPIILKKAIETDRVIIRKDRHLLDTAYAHDRIIITTDNKIQEALQRTGNEKMLQEIRWLNPCQCRIEDLYTL
jgi:hypothetical protein